MVMLEKTLESFLDCQEIKPVNPKGNQPWIFIGRTVAEAEAPAPILYNHLTWRALSLERRLMLGKFEGKRRGWEKMRWLDSITNSMDMNLSKLWEIMDRGDRTEGRGAILGITNSQTWLTDWPMNNPPIEDIFRSRKQPNSEILRLSCHCFQRSRKCKHTPLTASPRSHLLQLFGHRNFVMPPYEDISSLPCFSIWMHNLRIYSDFDIFHWLSCHTLKAWCGNLLLWEIVPLFQSIHLRY